MAGIATGVRVVVTGRTVVTHDVPGGVGEGAGGTVRAVGAPLVHVVGARGTLVTDSGSHVGGVSAWGRSRLQTSANQDKHEEPKCYLWGKHHKSPSQ